MSSVPALSHPPALTTSAGRRVVVSSVPASILTGIPTVVVAVAAARRRSSLWLVVAGSPQMYPHRYPHKYPHRYPQRGIHTGHQCWSPRVIRPRPYPHLSPRGSGVRRGSSAVIVAAAGRLRRCSDCERPGGCSDCEAGLQDTWELQRL